LIRLFGIPIRIHPLLWAVAALSALTGHLLEILVLFGVILIHELGHTAAASSLAWRVREIRLLPFGGVLEVEESGSVPAWQEAIVVLAGPAQNALMIAVAALARHLGLWSEEWADYFIRVNAMIGLFNLLPILPLDGGKLLQLALGLRLPYYQTLHAMYVISLLNSALMISVSLSVWQRWGIDLNLLMIGIFLFVSNWSDYRNLSYIFLRFLMGREARMAQQHPGRFMARPLIVQAGSTLAQTVKQLRREVYHVIYVCDEHGRIRQVLPELQLIRAYLAGKEQQYRAGNGDFRYNKSKLGERRT
jgi:stage IV sporulation protein FB